MPYKDPQKQREANRIANRRYRQKKRDERDTSNDSPETAHRRLVGAAAYEEVRKNGKLPDVRTYADQKNAKRATAVRKALPDLRSDSTIRASVESMASFGIELHRIAQILGVGEETLRSRYARELEIGRTKLVIEAGAVVRNAAVVEGDFKAAKFILERLGGEAWSGESNPAVVIQTAEVKIAQQEKTIDGFLDGGE